MSKITDSESQTQIEQTISGLIIVSSSTEEDEMKLDIKENIVDSVSSGIQNDVNISPETLIESKQGEVITLIDDLIVQEKESMVDTSTSFIYQIGSPSIVFSTEEDDLKQETSLTIMEEDQEMLSQILESDPKAQNEVKLLSEVNSVQSSISHDSFIVAEMQEIVEKFPKPISQSQSLVEVNNVSISSESWNCLGNEGGILKDITEIREKQGNDEKMEILEDKELQEKYYDGTTSSLKSNENPTSFPSSVSKTGYGCERKEIGKKRAGGCSENIKQEMVGKKDKCSKRNGKGSRKKFTDMKGKQNLLSIFAEARNLCQKKVGECKRSYSRNELEALRFVNGDDQRQIWKEIYTGLGPIVAKELNNIAESRKQNRNGANGKKCKNTVLLQHAEKQKADSPILGDSSSQNVEGNLEENIMGEAPNFKEVNPQDVICDDLKIVEEDEFEDDESYEDEYDSIKKPAFCVDGDPDFDSGPPQDGLEYLRRVRWEAAQIPNVKVVQVDRSKLNKEQTVYMPEIPEIARCPEHLQPSKEWEDQFLADFSKLRLALSHLEGSKSFPYVTVAEVDETLRSSRDPTLSIILGMDSVSRVSMLKRCIKSLDTKSSLSRNSCSWIFALCAAVDIPLHADTTAFVRSLLRKCASWRAEISESDLDNEEVVMLNMLVTISGRYFGQLD